MGLFRVLNSKDPEVPSDESHQHRRHAAAHSDLKTQIYRWCKYGTDRMGFIEFTRLHEVLSEQDVREILDEVVPNWDVTYSLDYVDGIQLTRS